MGSAKLWQEGKICKRVGLFFLQEKKENGKGDAEIEGLVSLFITLTYFNHL